MSEPFSVERLREMMDGAPPEMREHSTVLWAADEIERLRAVLDSRLRVALDNRHALDDLVAAEAKVRSLQAEIERLEGELRSLRAENERLRDACRRLLPQRPSALEALNAEQENDR